MATAWRAWMGVGHQLAFHSLNHDCSCVANPLGMQVDGHAEDGEKDVPGRHVAAPSLQSSGVS